MIGFGRRRYQEHSFWLLVYTQADEDTPAHVKRVTIGTLPGGDPIPQLLKVAHELLLADPSHWELLAHRGRRPEPSNGQQVVCRLSREPFNESLPYPNPSC